MATGVSMTHYTEGKILNQLLQGAAPAFTFPAGGLWIGLFTAAPTDTGGGTEVSGGGYARVQQPYNAAVSNGASSGSVSAPTGNVTFPTATADWGMITSYGLFDAATAGNLVLYGNLTTPQSVPSGVTATFSAAGTSVLLD